MRLQITPYQKRTRNKQQALANMLVGHPFSASSEPSSVEASSKALGGSTLLN